MGYTRGMNENEISHLLRQLAPRLVARDLRIATAESCTGGWVAKLITDLEGSSHWYECSIISYSNQAKHELLGVAQDLLDTCGAVSQPVVKAMVLGLLDRCNAGIGIAISGVAGPGGGSAEKPVGTVWIAWARPGRLIETLRFQFSGDREQVRLQSVYEAIKGVQRILDDAI